jgi:hypothetical protein
MLADTTRRRKHEHAFLYAYRGDGDMFELAMTENLPRARKRAVDPNARGPIPVIAGDWEAFEALTDARSTFIAQNAAAYYRLGLDINRYMADRDRLEQRLQTRVYSSSRIATEFQRLNKILENAEIARDLVRDKGRAARATRILKPDALRLLHPVDSKLYIPGHGFPGSRGLSSSARSEPYSLRKLARQLKAGGLDPEHESFRLTSCGSADAASRDTFVDDPPARSRRWFGATAPAQRLADELSRVGFTTPHVTGYQGLGVMYPGGRTALQAIDKPVAVQMRRSQVSKVFTPAQRRLLRCV